MIIIRSQDKEILGKYNEIKINEQMIVGFEGSNKITVLGSYKTRERAMEILDRIHAQITRDVSRDYMSNNYRVFQNYVFEMPIK